MTSATDPITNVGALGRHEAAEAANLCFQLWSKRLHRYMTPVTNTDKPGPFRRLK
ncbi:hypothetical protein GCM10017620_05070 [Brevundimonas intermedia]|uniref:Uncharacterized protein n=1 Tax=Brevundimonas intermedia TaxID=74315 RepID=A0ABQ5T6A0_9CAUL|nr:hypothetical protein GCM10017620_05070 [Brevundimonas intermedia]